MIEFDHTRTGHDKRTYMYLDQLRFLFFFSSRTQHDSWNLDETKHAQHTDGLPNSSRRPHPPQRLCRLTGSTSTLHHVGCVRRRLGLLPRERQAMAAAPASVAGGRPRLPQDGGRGVRRASTTGGHERRHLEPRQHRLQGTKGSSFTIPPKSHACRYIKKKVPCMQANYKHT